MFTRDKEAHILIRISVQKEDITVTNTYVHMVFWSHLEKRFFFGDLFFM